MTEEEAIAYLNRLGWEARGRIIPFATVVAILGGFVLRPTAAIPATATGAVQPPLKSPNHGGDK